MYIEQARRVYTRTGNQEIRRQLSDFATTEGMGAAR